MTQPFEMRFTTLLWPALFEPISLEPGATPTYRAAFVLPDGFVPPSWVFVKLADPKYGLPEHTRILNVSTRKPMPVFGISADVMQAMRDRMMKPDRLLHNASCHVIISGWENARQNQFYAYADAIEILSHRDVPTFESIREETLKGDSK